jgi:predicted O-methyltransferase YrrM
MHLLGAVRGFLDHQEGMMLYHIALAASKRGPCLEIGSYCGKSTIYIATACRLNNAILFSIDHHRGSEEQQPGEGYFDPRLFDPMTFQVDTFREFRKNIELAGLEDTVVPVVCKSEVAAKSWATALSLVFIDGGHSYEAVKTDYTIWNRHIMPDGFLLIHDIFTDPAEGGQAPYEIYRLALESGLFHEHPRLKSLGILQRIP